MSPAREPAPLEEVLKEIQKRFPMAMDGRLSIHDVVRLFQRDLRSVSEKKSRGWRSRSYWWMKRGKYVFVFNNDRPDEWMIRFFVP